MNFSDLLAFQMHVGKAALISVLGLVIVFAVLAVLVGILYLFRLVFQIKLPQKHKTEAESSVVTEAANEEEEESEIAAVIAAVLSCMDEEGETSAPFRVKSIRKLK